MRSFLCKRAVRFAAQHGCCSATNLIVGTRRNSSSCKGNVCNIGMSAFGHATRFLTVSADSCPVYDSGSSEIAVDKDIGSKNNAFEHGCPGAGKDRNQGTMSKDGSQARIRQCGSLHNHVESVSMMRSSAEKEAALCGGSKCSPEMIARCCHRQQVVEHDGASSIECDRTFCPPERGEHCPLASHGLLEPRGELSLVHPRNGGIQNLKRSLKCPHAYRALFVDAAGTLIHASQSTRQIYREIGLKYGVTLSEDEIAAKYKAAYGHPWCRYRMRYEDDGRFYWQRIVQEATGCKDPALLEDLYQYYTTDKAWHIGDPDAEKALKAIRNGGIKLAVVSNFDTRLRPLMKVLQCYDWFDTIVVSAEVGLEKPNPDIFLTTCKQLGVKPEQVLHVGDDETNDIVGASTAGCDSLLWGKEVITFAEVAKKLGVEV